MINKTEDFQTQIPFGASAENKGTFGQWQAFTQFISSYLSYYNNPEHTINLCLYFNSQYLVKIADSSIRRVFSNTISFSPLRKDRLSYHREYEEDNALLQKPGKILESLFPEESKVFFITCDSYISYLEHRKFFVQLSLDIEDNKKRIKKALTVYNSLKVHQLPKKVFVYFHIDQAFDSNVKTELATAFEKVKRTIKKYPFKAPDYKSILLKTAEVGFRCIIGRGSQILVGTPAYLPIVAQSGSTPTLQQSAKIYSSFIDLRKVFKIDPIPINNFSRLEQELFSFKNTINLLDQLSQSKNHKYLKILSNALSNILNFFDFTFAKKKSHISFINSSIERIEYFVKQMVVHKDNLYLFGNYFDLCVEEVSLLSLYSKPFNDGELEAIIKSDLVKPWSKPDHVTFNKSVMNSLIQIISTILQTQESTNTSIVFFEDIYFEIRNYLIEMGSRKYSEKKNSLSVFKVNTKKQDNWKRVIKKLSRKKIKINTLFVDIHSSLQVNRDVQKNHNLVSIIETMRRKKVLEDQFFLCIDNTIGTWGTNEIKVLLDKYLNEINDQRMHIFIYQSGQKLNLFGSDKFNSCTTLFYSKNPLVQQIHSNLNYNDLDYQMMSLIYKCAKDQIQKYVKRIIVNTDLLYSLLKPHTYTKSSQAWITRKKDKRSVYIELTYLRNSCFFNEFTSRISSSESIEFRSSFGYRTTTTTFITAKKEPCDALRITVGIEDRKKIEEIADFFHEILIYYNK